MSPRRVRAGLPRRDPSRWITALAIAGCLGACATTGPVDEGDIPAQSAVEAIPNSNQHHDPETSEPGPPEKPGEEAEGPYEFRVGERPFPLLPEGMTAIVVPTVERKAVAIYPPTPFRPGYDQFTAIDVPKPAGRNPTSRGRGFRAPTLPSEAIPSFVDPEQGLALGGGSPEPLSPLLEDFDSTDFDDNGALSGSYFIPPDPHSAAGPDHVVNVVNATIRFHTKAGLSTFHSDLASFFAPLVPLTATFDPKVIYDQFEDRFVVVTLEHTDTFFGDPDNTSKIFVAVSDDGDPSGVWVLAEIEVVITPSSCGVPAWADYPGLAVDEEAVYITNNLFGFLSFGGAFCGSRLWIIDKGVVGGFYDGGLLSVSDPPLDPYAGGGVATTTQPAHVFCSPGSTCPINVGTYLVSYSGLTNGSLEALQSVTVSDPLGSPTFSQEFIFLGDIEDFSPSALPPAPQSGSTFPIATNDRRALNAVWRDNDTLWMTATIEPNASVSAIDAGETTAAWAELDTSGATMALTQLGIISGDTCGAPPAPGCGIAADAHTFFPSIAVNDSGDVAIGFSASAPSIFPGSYFTTRVVADPSGFTEPAATLRLGEDTYERTFDNPTPPPPATCGEADSRWGDYSGMSVDPFDQCFWVYNEHAIDRGTPLPGVCGDLVPAGVENGRWGTAFGYFCESCPTNLVVPAATTIGGTDGEEARDSISSSTLTVSSTGDYTLTTASFVADNGLVVEGGGKLTVVNGPCATPPP